ncbi:hypothetical protein V2J09_013245, partial [Rumex salicifolius]
LKQIQIRHVSRACVRFSFLFQVTFETLYREKSHHLPCVFTSKRLFLCFNSISTPIDQCQPPPCPVMGAAEESIVQVDDDSKGESDPEKLLTDDLSQQQVNRNGETNLIQTHAPIQFPPPTRNPQQQTSGIQLSRMDRLHPTNPLRVVANNGRTSRAVPFSRPPPILSQPPIPPPSAPASIIPQPQNQQQKQVATLNRRGYTNKISLLLFIIHTLVAIGAVSFLILRGIQGILQGGDVKRKQLKLLKHFLPQVEAASLISIALALSWQMAVRMWPKFMVHFILWSSFFSTLSAGILLICFEMGSTSAVGVAFMFFSVGNGLYACWVTQRTSFYTKVLLNSLEPVVKFPRLSRPTYLMLTIGFVWMSLWILAVVGALDYELGPIIVFGLGLSLAWTTEVMRNVVNLTVSRVIALYYLRGMQSNVKFCFQRALTLNLGSASLGSFFVPSIEALRIVARGLNLLEGEDEFMFSCAHCCLRLMQSVFKFGNGWAYVQVAAYGKSFTKASIDTWDLFQNHCQEMEVIVDSDITSAICFLSGVCSGALCTIMAASWSFRDHRSFTATISVLAFFVGYLMTRIAMALPHACVSCYYVCYAEDPRNRLFDNTVPNRINMIRAGRDVAAPTARVPRRFNK